jgi:hypothetical protein
LFAVVGSHGILMETPKNRRTDDQRVPLLNMTLRGYTHRLTCDPSGLAQASHSWTRGCTYCVVEGAAQNNKAGGYIEKQSNKVLPQLGAAGVLIQVSFGSSNTSGGPSVGRVNESAQRFARLPALPEDESCWPTARCWIWSVHSARVAVCRPDRWADSPIQQNRGIVSAFDSCHSYLCAVLPVC